VRAFVEGNALVLSVEDDSAGLDAAANATGPAGTRFGLVQVRERLATLYGSAGSLTLEPAAEGGTRARIRLPLAALQNATPLQTDRNRP